MSYDDDLVTLLLDIKNDSFDPEKSLSHLNQKEKVSLIRDAEKEDFISHNGKQGIVQQFMGGGFMLNPSAFVRRAGHEFLEGRDRNSADSGTTFNIDSIHGSAIGNYNTVNNYSETPIKDLETFINEEIDDNADKKEGQELLETLKGNPPTPGLLGKFEGFISKYPKTFDLIASFAGGVLVQGLS